MIDETHDPAQQSWLDSAAGHPDFPVQNLPLGVFSVAGGPARIGCAIGDEILDLQGLSKAGLLPAAWRPLLQAETLNALIGSPASVRRGLRRAIFAMLTNPAGEREVEPHLRSRDRCEMHLPVRIGDYTDFYVGIHHALNVGRLFRPDAPLLPNYKHVPIGYHGRASSVRPSGVPVTRPGGQMMSPNAGGPEFGPCRRLDYELELGVWIGPGNELGRPIPIREADEHIAGFCLLNDWSARDLQAWEYQPLGPFLAKNFHTTVSPWVVTPEALAPFRTRQPIRPDGDPHPLPYLWDEHDQATGGLGVTLEAHLTTQAMRAAGALPHLLSQGSARHMYWTVAQMVTHHASSGCDLRPGDLLGTGTISGPDRSGFGSLLEITNGGADPIALPDGETRTFLEDGDEIVFSARAEAPGRITIGFGACRAMVLPAR
ncbi:MAG: fumarylacetoacetase [Caulobacter sp.]|nr:fumarylacetoacetase [Caulobacter sp.]